MRKLFLIIAIIGVGSPAITQGVSNPEDYASTSAPSVSAGSWATSLQCPPGPVIFVDGDATGAGDGSSWAEAFPELQDAMALAWECPTIIEIWVAQGVYAPTRDSSRYASFFLRSNLALYGGFAGGETSIDERDWTTNVSFLSGDIGSPGDNTDNSYHVVTASLADSTAVLDGFTVSHGFANGGGDDATCVVFHVESDIDAGSRPCSVSLWQQIRSLLKRT